MVSAMALILRRAREADLERADELVSRSINDITQRQYPAIRGSCERKANSGPSPY